MRTEILNLIKSGDMATVIISPVFNVPAQADVILHAAFNTTPIGTLVYQGRKSDSSAWEELHRETILTASSAMKVLEKVQHRQLRAVYTPDAQHQITTLTLDAALIAANVATCTVNGRAHAVTYDGSSDATLQALADAIATDADVQSAVVTSGGVLPTDDRVITITGKADTDLTITGAVTLGASQANVAIATSQVAALSRLQKQTYTLDAALVALNVAHCVIDGTDKNVTYASSSDETLQALADEIKTHADVEDAVVTVVTDGLGVDDRVITITSKQGKDLTISGSVTAGASQAGVTVAETVAPSLGTLWVNVAVVG